MDGCSSRTCRKGASGRTKQICWARSSPLNFNWALWSGRKSPKTNAAIFTCSSTSSRIFRRMFLLRSLRKPGSIVSVSFSLTNTLTSFRCLSARPVFGNVGTSIAFRIGHTDAEVMEKEFGKTFSVNMLADLNRYEAAVKLLEDGTNKMPFSGENASADPTSRWPEAKAYRPVTRTLCDSAGQNRRQTEPMDDFG